MLPFKFLLFLFQIYHEHLITIHSFTPKYVKNCLLTLIFLFLNLISLLPILIFLLPFSLFLIIILFIMLSFNWLNLIIPNLNLLHFLRYSYLSFLYSFLNLESLYFYLLKLILISHLNLKFFDPFQKNHFFNYLYQSLHLNHLIIMIKLILLNQLF